MLLRTTPHYHNTFYFCRVQCCLELLREEAREEELTEGEPVALRSLEVAARGTGQDR
ncbi:MAG: hypothetical protein WBZ19_21370 [Chthoniobacterales bacterium]